MRRIAALVSAALVMAAIVAGYAVAAQPADIRVEIVIRYSHFEPTNARVPHGVPVTFVLINLDPIDHEWLIGDTAFHERHRTGTEPVHGQRPNEVSVGALSTVETTITFDTPGPLRFICHLPGHEEYGMVGTVTAT